MNNYFLYFMIWAITMLILVVLIKKSKKIKNKEEKNLLEYGIICLYVLFLIDYIGPAEKGTALFTSMMSLYILACGLFIRFAISLFLIAKNNK